MSERDPGLTSGNNTSPVDEFDAETLRRVQSFLRIIDRHQPNGASVSFRQGEGSVRIVKSEDGADVEFYDVEGNLTRTQDYASGRLLDTEA